jgi:cyclohexanone monooxygenase
MKLRADVCSLSGAGFGGIHQLYEFLKLGLSVKVIDYASDVGGTWFW